MTKKLTNWAKSGSVLSLTLALLLFSTPAQASLKRELAAGAAVIGSVRQVDPDNDTRLGSFDSKFKAPIYIDPEHHEIHECSSFERYIDSSNTAVATINVAFKTLTGTKLVHIIFGFSSSDEILFEILEGATWTQGTGTALTIFNLNRDCGASSTAILEDKNQATFTASNQMIKDVTGVSGGTVIESLYTYNAGLGAAVSAETRNAAHEWNLKDNTTYVVRMTQTDGNCKMSTTLHWYEHTDE